MPSKGIAGLVRAAINAHPIPRYTTKEIYARIEDLGVTFQQVKIAVYRLRDSKRYRHMAVDSKEQAGPPDHPQKIWIRKDRP